MDLLIAKSRSEIGRVNKPLSMLTLRIVYIGECYAITPAIIPATATCILLAMATLGDMMAKVSKYSTISRTNTPAISC